jgi:hypothetical protein
MKPPALCSLLTPLTIVSLAGAATLSPPPAEEWPPVDPPLTVANGFQQTGWAESQWRNDTWEPTQRRELSYDAKARLVSVRNE